MAKNVIINHITYEALPAIKAPTVEGGMAEFPDTSDATLASGDAMLAGNSAYSGGVKYTGTIPSKAAATITPSTSDQTIAAGQYLAGAQTVKGDQNLRAENIRSGVSIFGIDGGLTSAVLVQDPVTRVLTIY